MGIRAAWAPPSLALERHNTESSIGPEGPPVLTASLSPAIYTLSKPTSSPLPSPLQHTGSTLQGVLAIAILPRPCPSDFTYVNLLIRKHILDEEAGGYVS